MTDSQVVLAVVHYLGRLAALLVVGLIFLTGAVLMLSSRSDVDPAAVGAVAAVSTLAGGVIGALGALLVSTRSSQPENAEPAAGEPVTDPTVTRADGPAVDASERTEQ